MTKVEKVKASLELVQQLIVLTMMQELATALKQIESKAMEGSSSDD